MADPPQGFNLDQSPDTGLPPGFQVDQPSSAPGFGAAVKNAVTGLPADIYGVGKAALSSINDTLNPFSGAYQQAAQQRAANPSSALTDWTSAGKGLAAIPQLIAAPLTGAVKAAAPVIAAPMTSAIQSVGEPIAKALNPSAALPSREDVFGQVEPQVEQALTVGTPGKAKAASAIVPTTQQLYDAADGDYAVARAMDVNIHPDSVASFANGLEQNLQKQWFRDYNAPNVFNVLKELQNPPANSAINIADVDGVRKLFGDAAGNFSNPTEQRAASLAIKSLDDYVRNIPQSDVLSGDAQAVQGVLESARGNYAAAKRADIVEGQQEKAERQAGVTGAGANINNALRQKMNAILNNKSMQRGFSPDEVEQIRQVTTGTPTGNLARKIGKLAPSGVVSGALGLDIGSTLLSGMPMGASIPALVGSVAKKIGETSTTSGIDKLSTMTRARSPLANQLAKIPPRKPQATVPNAGVPLTIANAQRMGMPAVQSPALLNAQENQQNVPGPIPQQKNGGAVGQKNGFAHGGAIKGESEAKGKTKATKSQANYRGGNAQRHCSICTKFIRPHGCKGVAGVISPRGLCDFYVAKEPSERIDATHTVKSGADSSVDGDVFIDHRIPARFHKYLAIHETVEGENMAKGYAKAHQIATAAEKKAVEADGVDWQKYTHAIDGYLATIEHEKNSNPPRVKLHVDPDKAIDHHHSKNKVGITRGSSRGKTGIGHRTSGDRTVITPPS